MCIDQMPLRSSFERGLTLIELIFFIIIVSVALAGVLTVLNITVMHSADPMIRKQLLSVAEAVLEEVQLQPFTWCDPDDSQAATAMSSAVGATGCTNAGLVEAIGSGNAGETRGSTTVPLDNVSDYHGAQITANMVGTSSSLPPGYSATVAITDGALNSMAAGTSLLITVTACYKAGGSGACPSGAETLVLQGYRTRFAPNNF